MARGNASPVGATRVSANGYHYTKTEDGWRLTHHLLAEEKLGRPLEDNERVYFVDKDRTNLSKDNVEVKETVDQTEKRIADLRARIRRDQDELNELLRKRKN